MQNAARILILGLGAAALAACQEKQPAANQDMSVESNLAYGELPPTAEIATLPPDESSATPSNQLLNGDDSPDVNDTAANSSD